MELDKSQATSKSLPKSSPRSISQQCAAKVMETFPLVMRFIRASMRESKASDLSVPQLRTLVFLDINSGASLTELAEHLGVTNATASANIERLVQRNFVHRCDRPTERRRIALKLTESGKEHLELTRQQARDYIAELLIPLTDQQMASIEMSLELLKQVFESKTI